MVFEEFKGLWSLAGFFRICFGVIERCVGSRFQSLGDVVAQYPDSFCKNYISLGVQTGRPLFFDPPHDFRNLFQFASESDRGQE